MKSARWAGVVGQGFALLRFGTHSRKLYGAGAEYLLGRGLEGRITFVDKPRSTLNHICAVGVPQGIALIVYPTWGALTTPTLAFVKMCPQWKTKLGFGRAGRPRWLRYKATSMGAWTGGTVNA